MSEFSEDLGKEIVDELLTLGENVAKESVESVFKIAEMVVKDSKNKFDDMLLPTLPMLKEQILKYVDKIKAE